MYFFVLLAIPAIPNEIPGLGIFKHLFDIDYLRLLALAVLFPAYLQLRKHPDSLPFGRSLPDKFIAGYILLLFGLFVSVSTLTNSIRHGLFYSFIDIFLPYYVGSRALKRFEDFRDALTAFVIAALIAGLIGFFEFSRHWLLYAPLESALGVKWGYMNYLGRGDSLRALSSTGHPIALGYVMTIALGFSLFLGVFIGKKQRGLGIAALLAGLIAPLSRGPWTGSVAMFLTFLVTGPQPVRRLFQLSLLGIVVLPILLATPMGDKIIALLPFVGTVDEFNVTYRERLLAIGTELILQNPLFGAYGYFMSAEMQELKQGNGMIDLVNSYLAVGLGSGLTGLFLFCGAFLSVVTGIALKMKKQNSKTTEYYLLGRALLGAIAGIMVIIFTVSSITVIPVIYWTVLGIGAAYARYDATDRGTDAPESTKATVGKLALQPKKKSSHL